MIKKKKKRDKLQPKRKNVLIEPKLSTTLISRKGVGSLVNMKLGGLALLLIDSENYTNNLTFTDLDNTYVDR